MDDQLQNNFCKFAPDVLKNDRVTIGGKLVTNAINVKQYKEAADNPDYYIVESKQKVLDYIHKECNNNKITQTALTKWIKKWAQVRGVEIDLSYKKSNDSGRFYRFISWPDQANSVPKSDIDFTENYF
jgi:hypothetical protein